MSVKDHSLDALIVDAAKKEFLENGFSKATLHDISERAGLTTGALYTRYKGKDDLFCSLIKPLSTKFSKLQEPLRNKYMEAREKKSMEMLFDSLRYEEKVYLDILFENYEECVLFFCKSSGSSMEPLISEMMEKKATETVEYLKGFGTMKADPDGIGLIISEQLHYYMQILRRGYSKDKAISCMKTVEDFLEAGWKSLFEGMKE